MYQFNIQYMIEQNKGPIIHLTNNTIKIKTYIRVINNLNMKIMVLMVNKKDIVFICFQAPVSKSGRISNPNFSLKIPEGIRQ